MLALSVLKSFTSCVLGLSEADVETFLLEWTNGGDGEAYLEELDASISDHIPLNQVFRDDCFQF